MGKREGGVAGERIGEMVGRESASATRLCWPGRWEKMALNSDRKERCLCWREEKGVDCLVMAETRGL